MVFANRCRGLVQIVAPGVADTGVDGLHSPFGLEPVFAEFDLAAHRPLAAGQSLFVLFETAQRRVNRPSDSVAKRVMPMSMPMAVLAWHPLLDFPLGLDAHIPSATRLTDGGILEHAQHLTAQMQRIQPSLGRKMRAILGLAVELELLASG